jgi:hypothetical protein
MLGEMVIRPNPYESGFVITRFCTTIQDNLLLFSGRYCPKFWIMFPHVLLTFSSSEEAQNYRLKHLDVFG